MSDELLALAVSHGAPLVMAVVAASCLGLPVPSSLLMLVSGSLIGAGEFDLGTIALGCLAAAVLGDQIGFFLGRTVGGYLIAYLVRHESLQEPIERAKTLVGSRGGPGVFFSRWLASPLGPYVNLIAGSMSMRWLRFTAFGVAGELVWVALYVGLGLVFGNYVSEIAELASNASAFIAAGIVAAGLGLYLWRSARGPEHGH
ncbi:DedA family protein [Consotaella aegiceratis]|uniref:DedA family protein n=1 Tax=Consotaella aegiceratis TaxID=3097961 RepID=UPI002F42E822